MKKSDFEKTIDKLSRGLEGKFGLRRGETQFTRKECTVQFLNSTTQVSINYRLGEEPWISIADLNKPENSSTLEWLLVETGIEKPPTPEQAFKTERFDEALVEPALMKKRQQLLEHARSMLEGDFTMMPALKQRARKYEQECQRYIALHVHK